MATKVSNGRYKTTVFLGLDENDKRKYKPFYAKTADEADLLALEFKIRKQKQEDTCNLTLDDAMEQYINSKDAILSPTTIREYKMIHRLRFQHLMNEKIVNINSTVLQKAVNTEIKNGGAKGKKLSPKSIKNATALVITSINFFLPDKRLKVTLPQQQKIDYSTPDGERLAKIFKAAEGADIEVPILLAAWLSLRESEICGLKWKDIKEDHIEINEAIVYANKEQISKAPKTVQSKRKILLPKYLKEKIEALPKESEYIINLKNYSIYNKFKQLLKKNGIEHCRFHDLRHSNASIMHQLGVPNKYAQERGGWSSDKVMTTIYQQTFDEEQKRIAEKIDNFFENLIKN